MVAGGLLGANDRGALGVNDGREGVNDGREGANEGGALGVNDGLGGAAAGGLNDGLDGAMEGDLPELNGEPWLRDEPKLWLGLWPDPMDWRPAPLSWSAPLRLGPACARREPGDPISRAAVSTTDTTAALRSFLSPVTNITVSFPSPAAHDSPALFAADTHVSYRGTMTQDDTTLTLDTRAAIINIRGKRLYGLHQPRRKPLKHPSSHSL